jgi:hypothetical protein
MTDPDPQEVERLLAAVEAGLRRLGFTERTIKDRRKATRARIEAHFPTRKI